MKLQLTVREAAQSDLRQLVAWIAKDDPRAAGRVALATLEAYDQLAMFPNLGRSEPFGLKSPPGIQMLPVPGFKTYLIFYQATEETVEILRVIHAARDIPAALANEAP